MDVAEKLASLRESGKQLFGRSKFKQAMEVYSEGLDLLGSTEATLQKATESSSSDSPQIDIGELRQTFLTNRSACFSKMEMFEMAIIDAKVAIGIRPSWLKAHHRCAQAFVSLERFDDAIEVYEKAKNTCEELSFIEKQIANVKKKMEGLSAVQKIRIYAKQNKTIIGCRTKLSLSMFSDESTNIGNTMALGEGNYSVVYKAMFDLTQEKFALKIIDKKKAERMSKRHPNLFNEIETEKKLLNKLFKYQHNNIMKLYHTFSDNSNLYFLSELANGGELWSKMRFGKDKLIGIRPSLARFYLAQTLNGLCFLAEHGVIHRDLKPENLLLHRVHDSNGNPTNIEFVKIIDFGTAFEGQPQGTPQKPTAQDSETQKEEQEVVGSGLAETVERFDKLTVENDEKSTIGEFNGPNFVGTPEYMSPETVKSKDPTDKVDMWSLGSVAYQLHSGQVPFKGGSPYLTFLKIEKMLYELPKYFSSNFCAWIKKIFILNPEERISAVESKKSAYFEDMDFTALQTKPTIPIPSLYEMCVEKVGDWLFMLSQKKKLMKLNEPLLNKFKRCLLIDSIAQLSNPDINVRSKLETEPSLAKVRVDLMAYLDHRCVLGVTSIFPLFFPSESESRFKRANDSKKFIGLSEYENGKFSKPFFMAHIGDVLNCDVDKLVTKLNHIEPTPKLLFVSGPFTSYSCVGEQRAKWEQDIKDLQEKLSKLKADIPIVPCMDTSADLTTYRRHFGADYFSFYAGGVLVIVINSALLREKSAQADEHIVWLEDQLLSGKFCALHCIVLTCHSFNRSDVVIKPRTKSQESSDGSDLDYDSDDSRKPKTTNPPLVTRSKKDKETDKAQLDPPPVEKEVIPETDEESKLPRDICERFLPKFQEAGTQVILCQFDLKKSSTGANNKKNVVELLKSTDLNPKLREISTSPNVVRLLRVFVDGVKTDCYEFDAIPKWLALEEENKMYMDDQKMDDDSSDDDFSTDSE